MAFNDRARGPTACEKYAQAWGMGGLSKEREVQRSAGPSAPIGHPDIGRGPSPGAASHPILGRQVFFQVGDEPALATSGLGAPVLPVPASIHRIAIKGDKQ